MATPANWLWSSEIIEGGEAVVFDIDGVLANADARQHFITGANCDWRAFFAACGEDMVIEETNRLLHLMAKQTTVVLLTGRPIETQSLTVDWLERNGLHWDLLIMRQHGTYDSSLIFKQQSVRQLKVAGFNLQLAFEDDQRNREMFQGEEVPCMYIHSGYYEERDALAAKNA